MGLFNKLPGYTKAPAGLEWTLFKKLPWILVIGSMIPGCLALYANIFSSQPQAELQKTLYLCLSLVGLVWFFVGLTAIGCIVVMIMKGPAYVADPYELPKEDKRLEEVADEYLR